MWIAVARHGRRGAGSGARKRIETADCVASFTDALREFTDGFLAIEADETGDRFAGLDIEPVLRIVIWPIVSLTA